MSMRDQSSENIKQIKNDSPDGSAIIMNPVASGDNVAFNKKSTQQLKEETPTLVPCCEGKELQINEDLVRTGLSAISVKHDTVLECMSLTRSNDRSNYPFSSPGSGLLKHRNSFRSLHRPDLKRVPCLRKLSPGELESIFSGYMSTNPDPKPHKQDPTPTLQEPQGEECVRIMMPTHDEPKPLSRNTDDPTVGHINGSSSVWRGQGGSRAGLRPVAELCGACASVASADVPSGMRLHGARARLYTSVLASSRTGDQLDGISITEQLLDNLDAEQAPIDDEPLTVQELQIILPPKPDDQMAIDPSTTTTNTTLS